jgi:hypothetical protein
MELGRIRDRGILAGGGGGKWDEIRKGYRKSICSITT